MKNLLIVLAIAVAAVTAVIVVQQRKTQQSPAEVEKLRAELAQKEAEVGRLREEQERARDQVRQVAQLSDEIAAQAAARASSVSNNMAERIAQLQESAGSAADSGGGESNLGKALAGMMNDPEMKSFIVEQQRAAMERLYSPFIKRMNLTPEEAKRFNEILAGTMERGMDFAASMFGGPGATNRSEMVQTMKAEQETMQQKMKELLGQERYAQYESYQLTVGERAQLDMFRQQNPGAEPITEEQTETLLAMMAEEKKNLTATGGASFPGQNPADIEKAFDPSQLEKLMEAQETVNQNVLARAGEILSTEQLASFGKFQTNQLQMMRMGLTMARKFMGNGGNSGVTAPK